MKYPRAFLVLCALGVLVILGSDLATPMIPLFAEELGASALEVGFIRSAYFMTRIFIELPVGLISDRIGRRKPIVLGLFLSALSAVICGSSPNIGQLIVGRAIWGVGAALYFASSTVLVLDMFQEDRGKALGIYQGVEFAGRFAGAPLGGALSEYFGFRVAFYATGAALLGGSALAMASKEFRDLDLGKTKSSHTRLLTSISLLRTWPIAVASMVGFLRTFNMQGITQTLIPLFQSGVLGFGPFDIGLLATTRTIGVVAMTRAHALRRLSNRQGGEEAGPDHWNRIVSGGECVLSPLPILPGAGRRRRCVRFRCWNDDSCPPYHSLRSRRRLSQRSRYGGISHRLRHWICDRPDRSDNGLGQH